MSRVSNWRDEIQKFYPDWYDGPPDPHVSIIHLRNDDGGFIDRWRCAKCDKEGTAIELSMKGGCIYQHKPCKHCGCAPVCASDCSGIGEVLGSPDVYVAGFDYSKEH